MQNGDFWQFRCWIKEEKKYYRLSLRTRDFATALEKAKKHYFDIQHQIRSGVKVFGITWRELVELYVEEQQKRVDTKRITAGRLVTIKSQLKHLLAFVGAETKVGEIGKSKFLDYAQYRRINKASVQEVTIRNEHATINSLIKFANRRGYLPYQSGEVEEIRIRGDDIGRRDTFTLEEYKTLYEQMRKWVAEKCEEQEKIERLIVRDFILIAANSFARFGELRQLKWKNVEVFTHKASGSDRADRMVAITIAGATSKVRKTRKITCRGGEYFDRLKKNSVHTKGEDFVFCSQRTGKMLDRKTYYRLWHDLLKKAKLEDKRHLSYYGLRHFGISARIYAGVSFEDLSALAGTSYAYISNHYSHVDTRKLLAAATKRFSVDKDGLIVRE